MQVHEPARLALELLGQGVTAMKIWPFDVYALRNDGVDISANELATRCGRSSRSAPPSATRSTSFSIPRPVAPARSAQDRRRAARPRHLLARGTDLDAELRRPRALPNRCGVVSRAANLGTVPWYREVFVRGALDVAHFDIAWIGGISEGQRITHLAGAFDRAIAPHDCTGPVTLIAMSTCSWRRRTR